MTESTIIVGAGPAGCAAAMSLSGIVNEVTLIDKAVFPRDKCCGDGLTTGALRLLEEIGFDPASVPDFQPVDTVWLHSPKQKSHRFALGGQMQNDHLKAGDHAGLFAAIAPRMQLDAALLDLVAEKTTTKICTGTELVDASLHGDHVSVQVRHSDGSLETLYADYLIAADGMWSPTRKALGFEPPVFDNERRFLGDWHAFRQYWKGVEGSASTEMHIWFEPELLPGYLWSFPLPNNRANIGLGTLRSVMSNAEMSACFDELLQRPHIRGALGANAVAAEQRRAWPIPARIGAARLSAHRTLFVGDAATACDPLTGEGIGQALLTGIIAGEAIASQPNPARIEACFNTRVQESLTVDMNLAGNVAKTISSPLRAEFFISMAGLNSFTRNNFARWLFEDYPRAILTTPKRWHKNTFNQPGAFSQIRARRR